MQALGFETFRVMGRPRRTRRAADAGLSQRVRQLVLLDIVPTRKMFQIVNRRWPRHYHWFFLIQPYISERTINAALDSFTHLVRPRPASHTWKRWRNTTAVCRSSRHSCL
jgi:hypothetical protein